LILDAGFRIKCGMIVRKSHSLIYEITIRDHLRHQRFERPFDSAVKWQKEAIDLLTEEISIDPLTQEISAESRSNYESRLNLYQSGKPYREVLLPTSWQTP
jgi:hypothetical protein